MNRLEGLVALVTGAASGIGRATALRLASEGAVAAVADIRDEDGERVVAEIRDAGGKAVYVRLDVVDEKNWVAALDAVLVEWGRVDILVNNAGLGDSATVEDTSLVDWERTIAINQTGVFLGMKCCAEALKVSGRGSVINISSIYGVSGGHGNAPAYHASKGAVTTLTKNVAMRWATEGVRVNSVHPGFISTPMLESAKGTDFWDVMIAETPMGRLGEPEEIAAAVAYLASDDASFVTGLELYVDGGYIAR